MRQSTSSTALTTTHHTSTARSYGRGRRVTTFTAPAPAKTDPYADLGAAVYGWGRIATPVAEPDTCALAWCVDCWVGRPETLDDGVVFHHSAGLDIDVLGFNGKFSDDTDEAKKRTIGVTVERYDVAEAPDVSEPASVYLKLGTAHAINLGPAKAAEFAAALTKARASAERLRTEGGSAERFGAITVVRTHDGIFQVGAVYDAAYDNEFGTAVFITLMSSLDAQTMRQIAHGKSTLGYCRPDSWDLERGDAARLAEALAGAATLAAADRRNSAVTA